MQIKSNYELARSIVRRYMAEFTNQSTPPKTIKAGFFAIIMKDTGDVWLNECTSFASTLQRFKNKGGFHNRGAQHATCVKEAIQRGSEIELWFLTQPARFSAQQLENELYEANMLAERKKPIREGAGDMYSIRHRTTGAYFVLVDRRGTAESTLLGNWLARAVSMETDARNKVLSQFIHDQAEDILKQVNFDITHIAKFDDREDEWLKRQCYIDEAPGMNMNLNSVD